MTKRARPSTCQPAFQAQVFSPRDRRTIRKSFKSLAEARAWRSDLTVVVLKGLDSAALPTNRRPRAWRALDDRIEKAAIAA